MSNLHRVTASFATCLELTGLRAVLESECLDLCFRWRLWSRPNGTLVCSLYALGAEEVKTPLGQPLLVDDSSLPPDCQPGDELFTALRRSIRGSCIRPIRGIEFGLVDVQHGLRVPVWATSLLVTEDFTVVRVGVNEALPNQLKYSFPWPVLNACRVVLEDGVGLVAYSIQALGGAVWVRLRWQVFSELRRQLRFDAQVFPCGLAEAAILGAFCQEVTLGGAGAVQVVEQNLIRTVGPFLPSEVSIRASLLDMRTNNRLQVLDSSLPASRQERWFSLTFPVTREVEELSGGQVV